MSEIYGKCGMNCSRCPWSRSVRQTMKTDEEFLEFCRNCKMVLGYSPSEKISNCVGCQTPDEKIPKGSIIPRRTCLARQCVTKMGIDNCAHCSRFPCGFIKDAGTEWTREKIEANHGKPISEEDYLTFVEPFEGLKHLKEIHATLDPSDIIEAITLPPYKPKIIDFPDDIPVPKEERNGFKDLHRLMEKILVSPLNLTDTDTFAQQKRLKNRIPYFLRYLWIFGRFGELKDEKGGHFVVDAKTFIENREKERTLGDWSFVENVIIKVLQGFGINNDLVKLDERWKTNRGALRKEGWEMKISFSKAAGGISALRALHSFALKLDEKYKKKAFKFFSNIDMTILVKD